MMLKGYSKGVNSRRACNTMVQSKEVVYERAYTELFSQLSLNMPDAIDNSNNNLFPLFWRNN